MTNVNLIYWDNILKKSVKKGVNKSIKKAKNLF